MSSTEYAVLHGVLTVAAISLVPPVLVLGFLHLGDLVDRVAELRRRRRPDTAPPTPPLEEMVARLRRLHPAVHHPARGTPMAKHTGAVLAYDETLAALALALGHGTDLPQLHLGGIDREAERMRVEHAVVASGVDLERPDRAA